MAYSPKSKINFFQDKEKNFDHVYLLSKNMIYLHTVIHKMAKQSCFP